jgi:hypothetical protein
VTTDNVSNLFSKKTTWNMKTGNDHGFAVEVGKYHFKKGKPAKVTISNDGADGVVVADSVAYVNVSDKQ